MPTANDTARALYQARSLRAPIDPLSDSDPTMTAEDAYAIQQSFVGLLEADGARAIGWKLGLTSEPMQQLLGVDQPDYAPILDSMVFDDGASVNVNELIQPKAEAEIALFLGEALKGPGVTVDQVRDSVVGAVAAIEIVDSRIRDWNIKLGDTIADLASSAATVKSTNVRPLDFDVRLCGMVISKNGQTVDTGAGAAALGDPLYAVAWLANKLSGFDVTLHPGEFVMTGSLHSAFPVAAGDSVVAEFDHLGSVTVDFIGDKQ